MIRFRDEASEFLKIFFSSLLIKAEYLMSRNKKTVEGTNTIKSVFCSVETEKCTDSPRHMLFLNLAGKNDAVSSSYFKLMCPRFLVSS